MRARGGSGLLNAGALAVCASVVLFGACGSESRGERCSPGVPVACPCPDGLTLANRSCQTDGTYGPCLGCGEAAPLATGDQFSQYVVSKLTLPLSPTELAHDIDGDGAADNRLGSIIQAVAALNLGPQVSIDAAVAAGTVVLLLEQSSTDSTQQNALKAGVEITRGQATAAAPGFNGGDHFVVDPADTAGKLVGDITGGVFTSQDPASSLVPVELILALPLVPGQAAVPLPITAARLRFQRVAGGKLIDGQLNGAIRKSDVHSLVLPAIAALITVEIKKPGSMPSLKTFDVDGNGTVSAAELEGHALIEALLAPDVAIFGASGSFDPNPGAPDKDALSLGVSFQAVGAQF